jgi:CheY-like chemotaxis protein
MNVLVAEADAAHRRLLVGQLTRMGHRVAETDAGPAVPDLVRDVSARLVFCDPDLSGGGSDLISRLKADFPEVFVVLLTAPGRERLAMDALRAGAVNFLAKPSDIAELRGLLEKYAEILQARDEERAVPRMVGRLSLTMELPNDLRYAPRVSDFLLRDVALCHPEADLTALTLGLQEMIQNAIEHGNLGITYDEKSRALEEGRFGQLVEQRTADPLYSARRVHIRLERSRNGFECAIRDEGAGFDWRSLPDPLGETGLLEMHGRGIYLTRFSYDSVEYNAVGNEVTLRKSFAPADASPASSNGSAASAAAPSASTSQTAR